jgi:REP element-mobilizing transposase RayT
MCTLRRAPVFLDARVVSTTKLKFLQCAEGSRFAVLAFTFMPDHLHGLVQGQSTASDFKDFCFRFRRRASSACWPALRQGLWQNGYHERVLRDSGGLGAVIAYILNNPVRGGLVDRADQYPHSWSITLVDE